MKSFVKAICSNDANLPKEIKSLNTYKRDELKQLCTSLQETIAIFSQIALASPAYKDKDYYVIKRVYEMSDNYNEFQIESDQPNMPSDAEIVCSVFCALLDYSLMKDKHAHFLDNNVTFSTIRMNYAN